MHAARLDPADLPVLSPVTRIIPSLRALAHNAAPTGGENTPPGMLSGRNGGRGLMRRMLIAAAIAGGLVALWALLVPVIA